MEDPDADQVICVYGMPGVGKTYLLRRVYTFHKVGKAFNDAIWVTVSQDCTIAKLQDQIAKEMDLDFSGIADIDTRKEKLYARLKNKKFLLILDDMWSTTCPRDLRQVLGVRFADGNGSKVVFSTRSRDITLMREQKFIEVKALLPEEGRALFETLAFGEHVPEQLTDCAGKIADECKGLPLAITVVAAAMSGKTEVNDWNLFLSRIKIADPSFPNTHPDIHKGLYQILRLSYDDLARADPNLQHCFLYCAMYPEDEQIDVDALVRMWIAEGLVPRREGTEYSTYMDIGRGYVKNLIDRSLFQDVSFERAIKHNVNKPVNVWKARYITVHDVIRDMAIYVAEKENFLCRAYQQLRYFPRSESRGCKRISLIRNQIEKLPEDSICPNLVSLILSENPIYSVSDNFLIELNSLRVLDLSHTQIASLPPSLTGLGSLEFLTLSSTNIKELPTAICTLSKLQFLDISLCRGLRSLPPKISELTSLKRLHLGMGMEKALDDPAILMALKGLRNLIELHLFLFLKFDAHEIMATIMGTWPEMRHLYFHHMNYVKCNLPPEMQNMKKLQSLVVVDYIGVNLSNKICDFQQLERLELDGSDHVKELPPFERLSSLKFLKLRNYLNVRDLGIGSSGNSHGFRMLEMLHLCNMPRLRSIAEEGELKDETLLKLHVLKIQKCPVLRKLPTGMDRLAHVKLYGHKNWWENIIWEDNNTKMHLLELFKEI